MKTEESVGAIFASHAEAEGVVRALRDDNFDMANLSIAGRDQQSEEHLSGCYDLGDRMMYWGQQGAFQRGSWGLLSGSAFYWVPGVGPLLVAGPLVRWMLEAFENKPTVANLSALGVALYNIGTSLSTIAHYESAIQSGKYLLLACGSTSDVQQAEALWTTKNDRSRKHALVGRA